MNTRLPLIFLGLAFLAPLVGACSTTPPPVINVQQRFLVASAEPATLPPAETPAAPKPADAEALNKESQNPIASLISLPLQNNTGFGVGPGKKTTNVLNIQPVLPFALSDDLNLIVRDVTPMIYRPAGVTPDSGSAFGLGDSLLTGFLTPVADGEFTWGVGPAVLVPTSTRDDLGAGEWGLGPSAIAVLTSGKWVVGGVVNNVWSFEGSVNKMALNPFVNYNLPDAWALQTLPIIAADWKADSGDEWTVPLGGGVSKLVKIGRQPVVLAAGGYYHVVRPDRGARWTLQFLVKFLFPK